MYLSIRNPACDPNNHSSRLEKLRPDSFGQLLREVHAAIKISSMPPSKPKCNPCRMAKKKCVPGSHPSPQPCERCKEKGLGCSGFQLSARGRGLRSSTNPTPRLNPSSTFDEQIINVESETFQDMVLKLLWLRRLEEYERFIREKTTTKPWRFWIPLGEEAASSVQDQIERYRLWVLSKLTPRFGQPAELGLSYSALASLLLSTSVARPSLFDFSSLKELKGPSMRNFINQAQNRNDLGTALMVQEKYLLLIIERYSNRDEWDDLDKEWESEFQRYSDIYCRSRGLLEMTFGHMLPSIPPMHNLLRLCGNKAVREWLLTLANAHEPSSLEDCDMLRRTLLHLSLDLGDTDIPLFLFDEDSETLSASDIWDRSPLHIASSTGSMTAMRQLFEANITLNDTDENGWQALHYASAAGHDEMVKLLLEKVDADPGDILDYTPLIHAAGNGHLATVKLLLQDGANIESKAYGERTPLSCAAEHGTAAVVELLLEKGADVRSTCEKGQTPLSYALGKIRRERLEIVRLLVQWGSDVEALGYHGRNALSHAAEEGDLDLVQLLLSKGANINSVDENDRTALSYASEAGHVRVIAALLES
ncbi:hypothetical protein ACJZ2D_011084 [Fusarium nematophilum]